MDAKDAGWVEPFAKPINSTVRRWVSRWDRTKGRSDRSTHPTRIDFMETLYQVAQFCDSTAKQGCGRPLLSPLEPV
jgi:hypothetical protein